MEVNKDVEKSKNEEIVFFLGDNEPSEIARNEVVKNNKGAD